MYICAKATRENACYLQGKQTTTDASDMIHTYVCTCVCLVRTSMLNVCARARARNLPAGRNTATGTSDMTFATKYADKG